MKKYIEQTAALDKMLQFENWCDSKEHEALPHDNCCSLAQEQTACLLW
jgi:hypothetical protein